jgi:hypothetical protein
VYLAVEAAWRAPELGWLAGGLSYVRGKSARTIVRVAHD